MAAGSLGLIGGLVGGVAQAGAASSAANAQSRAADQAAALQREQFNTIRGDLAPYRTGGLAGQNALLFELGLGNRPMIGGTAPQVTEIPGLTPPGPGTPLTGRAADEMGGGYRAPQPGPTRFGAGGQMFDTREQAEAWAAANPQGGTEYRGFQATPGYDFRVSEGLRAAEGTAAARGGLFSGNALAEAQRLGQGYANQEYDNYLNRLTGVSATGLNAAGMGATAGQNFANAMTGIMGARGNAQAAGAIGVGNAISDGIGNALGAWQYQRAMQPAAQPTRQWWLGK